MSISNLAPLIVPKVPTTLAKIKTGNTYAYLGKVASNAETSKLVADFKEKVALFHDTTSSSTTFILKDLIRQNDQTFNLRHQLSCISFTVKRKFVQLTQKKHFLTVVYVIAFAIYFIALAKILKFVNTKISKTQTGKITLPQAGLAITAICISRLCTSKIVDVVGSAWLKYQLYLELNWDDQQTILKPRDLFLTLERRDFSRDRKAEGLSNRTHDLSQCLIDPIDKTLISEHDLNSPRVIVIGKSAVHVRSLIRQLLNQKNKEINLKQAVPQLAPSQADEERVLSDLRCFFCIQSGDLLENIWNFAPIERKLKLKEKLNPVFHKYIE